MLVLARKIGQSIIINENIELIVIEVRGDQVRLGISAPKEVSIYRKELLEEIKSENTKAAMDSSVDNMAAILGKVPKKNLE